MFCGFGFLSPARSSCRLLYLVITVVCCAISWLLFFGLPYDRKKICSPVSPVFAYGNCLVSLSRIPGSLCFVFFLLRFELGKCGRMVLASLFLLASPFETPTGFPVCINPPHPPLRSRDCSFSFLSRGTGKGGHAPTRRPVPPPGPNAPRSAAPRCDALENVYYVGSPSSSPSVSPSEDGSIAPFPNHLYPSRVVGLITTTGSRLQTPNRLDRHTGVSVDVQTLLGEPARPHRDPHNPPIAQPERLGPLFRQAGAKRVWSLGFGKCPRRSLLLLCSAPALFKITH